MDARILQHENVVPEERENTRKAWYSGPFLNYELVVWIGFSAVTILAIVDRFTWQFWPRNLYKIGNGSAGTDFMDGLKPGPWTVQLYDIVARVSGRYTIVGLNLLLFTMMKTLMNLLAESWIARHLIDFSDAIEGNRRLHKWNGILIAVMTLFHVWSILFPCIFHGWRAEVILGSFEWILSERSPKGFKEINLETETMGLQGDDVFRIVEMTILLAILLPLSVHWFSTRWHLGIHVHNIVNVLYFIDIVRRHTHPHSWILNTPFFVGWILDSVIAVFWRRSRPKVHRLNLSDDYIALFTNEKKTLNTVGPKYYIRLAKSSFLERAHVFTAFENRANLNLADGNPWTTCLIIRVYHSKRRPALGRKDKVSHTQRVAEAEALDVYQWGPYLGSMSEAVYRSLSDTRPVTLVAGGSAAGYIVDALQQHKAEDATLTCLYTVRDPALFAWVVDLFNMLVSERKAVNVQIIVSLTHGGNPDANTSDMIVMKNRELQESDGSSSSSLDREMRSSLSVQYGRLNFEKCVPENSIVYFQGSGGLQKTVHRASKLKKCRFIAGPAYDQDPSKKRFLLKGLRMNCLTNRDDIV